MPANADQILEIAEKLPLKERILLLDTLDAINGVEPLRELPRQLSDLEQRVIETYANIPDVKECAKAIGVRPNKVAGTLLDPVVGKLTRDKLTERSKRSELTGDYVRDYIFGILELCPTDYFIVGDDGDWCIDPEEFRKLPSEVKRYVESVDIKVDRKEGKTKYSVKFVSKSQALALASKYTMVEKHAVVSTTVPWGEIAGAVKALPASDADDPLEKEIASVTGG